MARNGIYLVSKKLRAALVPTSCERDARVKQEGERERHERSQAGER